MIDIKKILLDNGVDEEIASKCTEEYKKEFPKYAVEKEQYNKIARENKENKNKIVELETEISNLNADEWKEKFEAKELEFEQFKQGIETEKINSTKKSKLTELLKKEGANEKLIGLLLKEFDLEKIELEEDNIKDWENVIKPVKEGYSDCFSTIETVGTPSATPPQNITGNTFTREQINNMSESEINANWDSISKSLENLR